MSRIARPNNVELAQPGIRKRHDHTYHQRTPTTPPHFTYKTTPCPLSEIDYTPGSPALVRAWALGNKTAWIPFNCLLFCANALCVLHHTQSHTAPSQT
jgi:hypothetical protein